MKLYRFIGEKECNSILAGEKQANNFDWSTIYDSTSKGICFFAYNRTSNIDRIIDSVLNNWGFAGIVKDYAIVEIDVPKARKAKGFYADGYHTEFNLYEYSLADVKNIWLVPHKTHIYFKKPCVLYDYNAKAENIYKKDV